MKFTLISKSALLQRPEVAAPVLRAFGPVLPQGVFLWRPLQGGGDRTLRADSFFCSLSHAEILSHIATVCNSGLCGLPGNFTLVQKGT